MGNATLRNIAPASKPGKKVRLGLLLLSLAASLYAAGPVSAKDNDPVEACRKKYNGCNQRCANRYPTDWLPCIKRTCDKQYDNCIAAIKKDESIRPTAGNQNVPWQPGTRIPASAVPGRMPGGGLLDTTPPRIPPQTPAPAGTAVDPGRSPSPPQIR